MSVQAAAAAAAIQTNALVHQWERLWNDTQPSDTYTVSIDIKRRKKNQAAWKGMECKQTFLYITLICTRKCMWEIFYVSGVIFSVRVKCFELLAIHMSNKNKWFRVQANFSWNCIDTRAKNVALICKSNTKIGILLLLWWQESICRR